MNSREVDVVIVAYGSAALIAACLESVLGLAAVASVTVVDHGVDGSADIAEALGARTMRDPANPGFGAGQNAGAAMGQAPFVLMLNPDASMHASSLDRGLDYLESHPRTAAVQGIVRGGPDGSPERSQGRALAPIHLLGRATGVRRLLRSPVIRQMAGRTRSLADSVERIPPVASEVDALAATATLVRRAALTSVGGFDERYFLYGEDMDLSMRLRQQGWSLVALPVAWAEHVGGASAGSSVSRELLWWRGTLRYAAQWWRSRDWPAAILAGLAMALRLTLRSPCQAPEIVQELVAGPLRDRRSLRRSRASAGGRPSPTPSSPGRR